MAFKSILTVYEGKNFETGLTVKANIFKNGVATTAVGVSAVALTEVDSTNAPGWYQLTVASASLVTLGFTSGDTFEARIDATNGGKSAPASYKEKITTNSVDDVATSLASLNTKVGTPAGASVSADIASIKSDTAAIKVDLESGSYSLQTINSAILALSNSSISNGVGFVLPVMLIPSSGSNTYRIPVTIMNNSGVSVDPDSNTVTVGLLNAAGTDRGSYLTGSAGGPPLTVAATRDSTGQYHVTVALPSTAVEEELLFSFTYTISSNPYVRYGQSQTVTDQAASGFALQSTLLDVQTDVDAIEATVNHVTYGNAAIEGLLTDASFGLAATKAVIDSNTTTLSDIEGGSFSSSTDSLHAISAFLSTNLYSGGRAV